MKIIGLGHYSRVGKDTAADILVNIAREKGLRAKKISFAWKLKDICYELYAWAGVQPPSFYETDYGAPARDVKLPELGKTPVELWVEVGNILRERVHPETWVNYVVAQEHHVQLLVIPDVRYLNEVEAIRKAGGSIIKVLRDGVKPRDTVADQALVDFRDWDYVLFNDASIEALRHKLENIYEDTGISA